MKFCSNQLFESTKSYLIFKYIIYSGFLIYFIMMGIEYHKQKKIYVKIKAVIFDNFERIRIFEASKFEVFELNHQS